MSSFILAVCMPQKVKLKGSLIWPPYLTGGKSGPKEESDLMRQTGKSQNKRELRKKHTIAMHKVYFDTNSISKL